MSFSCNRVCRYYTCAISSHEFIYSFCGLSFVFRGQPHPPHPENHSKSAMEMKMKKREMEMGRYYAITLNQSFFPAQIIQALRTRSLWSLSYWFWFFFFLSFFYHLLSILFRIRNINNISFQFPFYFISFQFISYQWPFYSIFALGGHLKLNLILKYVYNLMLFWAWWPNHRN